MNKLLTKKAKAIIGGALLATSLIAIPVFAATSTEGEQKPVDEARSFMNYEAMQEVHNSDVMQEAMRTGDITKMQEAMNSPQMKEIMGEEALEQMNKHMEENAEVMGQMMSQFQGNGSTFQGMMDNTSMMR